MYQLLRPSSISTIHTVAKLRKGFVVRVRPMILAGLMLITSIVSPAVIMPIAAHADDASTCAPNGIVTGGAGSSWYGGNGVNVCDNGSSFDDNYGNECVPISGAPGDGTCSKGSIYSGYEWQCVELVNRFYMTQGWITSRWAGNGSSLINYLPSNLTDQLNGSISYVNQGDVITLNYGSAGHAAVINTVSGNTVNIINQNAGAGNLKSSASVTSGSFTNSNATFTMKNWLGYSVQAIVHHPNTNSDPTPPSVSWNFENLEGGSNPVSPYQGNVGHAPASVVFNSQLYNYYYDSTRGDLRVAYTHPGWLFDVVDGEGGGAGKLSADVGQIPSTVVFNNVMYVFYYDNTNGNLRMAWSSDGTSWQAETLDGDAGSLSGYNANVGQTPYVAVYNNSLQLFYYQPDQSLLRHAWSSNGSSWNFETLDGNSSSVSHFSGNVGLDPSVVVYNGALEVLYYNSTQGDLRHAWSDANGWHFENLDGDAGSVGHSGDNVGGNPTAFVFQSNLGILYYDKTIGALRHAWADASGWHFETLAGGNSSILGIKNDIGTTSTAVVDGTTLQVFVYQADYGDLEHIWNDGSWHAENLDGAGGSPSGRINANVGLDPDAIMFGSTLDVFYYDTDHGALRHTWPN